MLEKVLTTLKYYAPYLVIMGLLAEIIAWKLRLLKKVGFYWTAVGTSIFVTGILAAGNPILLLIGTVIILAGIFCML